MPTDDTEQKRRDLRDARLPLLLANLPITAEQEKQILEAVSEYVTRKQVQEIDQLFSVANQEQRDVLGQLYQTRYANLGGENPQTLAYITASDIGPEARRNLKDYVARLEQLGGSNGRE